MIVVKLIGGLGNQMFQYAAGKHLAHLHKTDLFLDISALEKEPNDAYTKRSLELNLLNVEPQIASKEIIEEFKIQKSNKITRTLQRTFPKLFTNLYAAESGNLYQKQFFNFPKNTYLDGFWQSEKYFSSIKSILLKEFLPKQTIDAANQQWLTKIQSVNSVSLHVRRGDYVLNKTANAYHGVCGIDYYNTAVEYLKNKTSSIELFVFSDDLEWCKQNLNFNVPMHLVDANQTSNKHLDMYLMSQCKHNVIANSSFSWWGAWLNSNTEKIVIAPKKWYAHDNLLTTDLIPKEWIQL